MTVTIGTVEVDSGTVPGPFETSAIFDDELSNTSRLARSRYRQIPSLRPSIRSVSTSNEKTIMTGENGPLAFGTCGERERMSVRNGSYGDIRHDEYRGTGHLHYSSRIDHHEYPESDEAEP